MEKRNYCDVTDTNVDNRKEILRKQVFDLPLGSYKELSELILSPDIDIDILYLICVKYLYMPQEEDFTFDYLIQNLLNSSIIEYCLNDEYSELFWQLSTLIVHILALYQVDGRYSDYKLMTRLLLKNHSLSSYKFVLHSCYGCVDEQLIKAFDKGIVAEFFEEGPIYSKEYIFSIENILKDKEIFHKSTDTLLLDYMLELPERRSELNRYPLVVLKKWLKENLYSSIYDPNYTVTNDRFVYNNHYDWFMEKISKIKEELGV